MGLLQITLQKDTSDEQTTTVTVVLTLLVYATPKDKRCRTGEQHNTKLPPTFLSPLMLHLWYRRFSPELM